MSVNRTAFALLSCLTLHFSLLSFALHESRTRPPPFHPSTAILITEWGKIIVCLAVVAKSGELREVLKERWRSREVAQLREREVEERRELQRERDREQEREREWDNEVNMAQTGPRKLHQRKASSSTLAPPLRNARLTINVERAQSFVPPSFAVIPPTPAPEPSPTRAPEVSLLFPCRPLRSQEPLRSALDDLREKEWWRIVRTTILSRDRSSMALIAGLYALQNRAQYAAAENLSIPVSQLAYQLKIPATAISSVILLNRSLSTQQWISLFVLAFGVGLVQLFSAISQPLRFEDTDLLGQRNHVIGLWAVAFASISSGIASCSFERILKVTSSTPARITPSSSPTLPSSTQPAPPDASSLVPYKPSFWLRNVQLSTFGLCATLPFILYDLRWSFASFLRTDASRAGVLADLSRGFSSPLFWFVVALQISGGLLSGLVILHADSLLSRFALPLSVLLSLFAAIFFFGYTFTLGTAAGATLVLAATLAYISPSTFQVMMTSPFVVFFRIRSNQ